MLNFIFYSFLLISFCGFILLVFFPFLIFIIRKVKHDGEWKLFRLLPSDLALYGANVMIASATVAGLIYSVNINQRIYRPYVGIEKIEINKEVNRLNAKTTVVNSGFVPANNIRINLKQFVDGKLVVTSGTDQSYSAFLLPVPNHIVYRFWGDVQVIDGGHDWTIQLTLLLDLTVGGF
jgi:hypothetical protein